MGLHIGYKCKCQQNLESPGLFDRLIADDYSRVGLETLTLDRRMATLPNARRL